MIISLYISHTAKAPNSSTPSGRLLKQAAIDISYFLSACLLTLALANGKIGKHFHLALAPLFLFLIFLLHKMRIVA